MTDADTSELQPYIEAGWKLIPLHKHDYMDAYKGKPRERGKSPIDNNWTKRHYNSKDQIGHMEKGGNVGVRLREGDLVIDVDPRNFKDGDDPIRRLCEDCGIDPELYPTVETGSGGLHIYMTKPSEVSVRDSMSDYEGVEFKTIGRQVVSAGSIHPTTKKTYVWDFLRPDLGDVKAAPDRLLNVIRRPTNRAAATGGGEHDQYELATMLDGLDPEDFRDQGEWFQLMQACHHATAGDGRSEFIEWSTRDPQYGDDGALIGRRWDSLHADNGDGNRVTFRTLYKAMRDAGVADLVPARSAEEDFDVVGKDDLPKGFSNVPPHEQLGPVERMNNEFCSVMENGQFKIFWQEIDPDTGIPEKGVAPRSRWIKAKDWDFRKMLSNRKVQKGKKTVSIADAWLDWGGRRSARGVVFDPERDHEGFLNLWTGWGYEPRKGGSWGRLHELLHEVLCDGDDDVLKYVLDWGAYMVQHPGRPAEVAICFQGGKGVGKGTWGRTLAQLAGRHGMQITSSEQLTGRFNSHLRDVIVLFADEALKPYDKDGESRLKGLITEPMLAYEGKGENVQSGKNRLHVVMASNEDWFVPAGLEGERRFMLCHANGRRAGQHAWFGKLNEELDRGGYSALLWDLLQRDIGDWAPRSNVPSTKALTDQKLRNMSPIGQWWFNALNSGIPPFDLVDEHDWHTGPCRAFYQDVRSSYDLHCRNSGIRHPGGMGRSLDIMFGAEVKKYVPVIGTRDRAHVPEDRPDIKAAPSDGRATCYVFPSLGDCRCAFEALIGSTIDWETEEEVPI